MVRTRSLSAAAAAFLALLSLPATATAVPATNPAPPTFEDVSQVVSVQVPVEVVGRDGVPVRGLKASDFEILDDNHAQPLSSFNVVDLDVLEPVGSLADELPTAVQELDAASRRHFLLLFDLSFSRPSVVLRAREAARDFVLHSLRPTDLVGVATYSLQTGPRLVVTFTTDRAQVVRGILSLGLDKVNEQAKVDPLRFMIAPPAGAETAVGGSGDRPEGRGALEGVIAEELGSMRAAMTRADRSYSRNLIRSYMQAMGGLAKILSQIKGRKHVVLFSEGFDSNLLVGHDTTTDEAAQENLNLYLGETWLVDNDNRFGNTQLQSQLRQMLRDFKRADCVIEAVDISGLATGSDASEQARVEHGNGLEELFETANETGGELLTSSNDFRGQLEHVLARSAVTYMLSFERSDLKSDGVFHHLKVNVKAPAGARVSYRTGYYSPRPFPELDPLTKTLLASDSLASAAPSADLDLNVLATQFRSSGGKAYVPVIVEVGGPRLLAGRKSDKLAVELYTYVSDNHGQMQDFFTQKVAVDLTKAGIAAVAAGLKYYGHVELPPGQYLVRVLVRESESGRTGVQTVPLNIPAWDTAAALLLPPFFVDSRSGWLMVREHAAEAAKKQTVIYPFTVNGEPYVPAALGAVADGGKAKVCLVGYNLGTGDLALQAKVLAADGAPQPGGDFQLVERSKTGSAGVDKLVATFQPKGLGAGRYTLQVEVTNRKTGRQQISSAPFEVVH